MAKHLLVAAVLFFASTQVFADDAQLETLKLRLNQQSSYIYSALAAKTTESEVKKIRKEVNDHVDVFASRIGPDDHVDMFASRSEVEGHEDMLVQSNDEDLVYRNIRKLTFLKTYLSRYYSAGEVQTILINTNLIATFGRDKLGK